MMIKMMMSALLCYLVLLPQRQLRLLLLQFLRTVHHKVDYVDAAGQRQQHQDIGYDTKTDQNCPEDTQKHADQSSVQRAHLQNHTTHSLQMSVMMTSNQGLLIYNWGLYRACIHLILIFSGTPHISS